MKYWQGRIQKILKDKNAFWVKSIKSVSAIIGIPPTILIFPCGEIWTCVFKYYLNFECQINSLNFRNLNEYKLDQLLEILYIGARSYLGQFFLRKVDEKSRAVLETSSQQERGTQLWIIFLSSDVYRRVSPQNWQKRLVKCSLERVSLAQLYDGVG